MKFNLCQGVLLVKSNLGEIVEIGPEIRNREFKKGVRIKFTNSTSVVLDNAEYLAVFERDVIGYYQPQKPGLFFKPELIPAELKNAPFIRNRERAREEIAQVAGKEADDSLWLEFGVAEGKSARVWLKHLPANCELHLFDTFEGLPEAWNTGDGDIPAGERACAIPSFDDSRVKIFRGLFQDVLPSYDFTKKVGFVHIDCDIYSGTVCALEAITPYVVDGTIILFDELYGYTNYKVHEWKAFCEWRNRNPTIHIEWLWRSTWSACGKVVFS